MCTRLVQLTLFASCLSSTAFLLQANSLKQPQYNRRQHFFASTSDTDSDASAMEAHNDQKSDAFDLDLALFCGGLAFDAYLEPPANSSRWERGSKGLDVAFLSAAFTRNLYKGLVEITPIKSSGLPDDDDGVEALITGGGVDACVMVAAVEGQWEEDINLLKQQYHEGIMDLTGAAHIGRSSTAWSNVNEAKSKNEKKKTGKALPYHVRKSWGKDASAYWPEEEPFYIYVQDPANVQLLFTLYDDDVLGEGSAIGSTYTPLSKVLPQVKYSQEKIVTKIKSEILQKIKNGEIPPGKIDEEVAKAVRDDIQVWEGDLKLTSKARIKNKNSQVAMGMAAGAMFAGPVGAAVGAAVGNMYEGQVKGRITLRLRYLPIQQTTSRNRYIVTGGLPGIDWGSLYLHYLARKIGIGENSSINKSPGGDDLEHCFFINHSKTGGCCAVYRSLEKKLIVVSFRGTCETIDLVTDASIVQEAWVKGDDTQNPKEPDTAKVHVGFRRSMDSISRRLKELILAAVGPGQNISDYDMLVTGHSLGGALATLFIADIGEYGIDAGRSLPTTDQSSDAWWKAIANTFMGSEGQQQVSSDPPRPKTLRLYNFGSPRVGNKAFSTRFDSIMKQGNIDEAYRVVNGKDVVARMPRTMGAFSVDYDHCGSTVLVQEPTKENPGRVLWIEGESDDKECPVRDYARMMSSPTAEGTLLGDLLGAIKADEGLSDEKEKKIFERFEGLASRFSERLSTVTAADITSILGIDKSFTERELQMVEALLGGEALAHHLENSYYSAMGSASGFVAIEGETILPLDTETMKLFSSEVEQNRILLLDDDAT